ncbi:MAG: hydroxymethylbilane synthase [Bdellovibrionales bacterium]|nr:hydroxymethylbilane synthase [Bdellovibrionales bacterium]
MKKILKLGTRRSLLAWTQSSWVAREIEKTSPDIAVELVGIETQGDRIQDIPLQKVEGKEFFVAEIDQALRAGSVDLTVHSLKDLSLDRPSEFVSAAIPRRENSRDVILFGPHARARLAAGQALKIGTSSPRRLENLRGFLDRALPFTEKGHPRAQFVEIRGNVNTRLSRVHEAVGAEKYLDGVVLAFAGLIRLNSDSEAREKMAPLMRGIHWMVLPLTENPTAPGQGALAIECRANDSAVQGVLKKLDHATSRAEVAAERAILRRSGGGCHQKFGASALTLDGVGKVLVIRGRDQAGVEMNEIQWDRPAKPAGLGASGAAGGAAAGAAGGTAAAGGVRAWDGSLHRAEKATRGQSAIQEATHARLDPVSQASCVFVAHSRAVPTAEVAAAISGPGQRVWTAGVQSWWKLAEKGIWVEGCAEGFGWDHIRKTLSEPILGLSKPDGWVILTHEDSSVEEGTKVATYRISEESERDASQDLVGYTHFFWGSGTQFQKHIRHVPPGAHHACGAGKTAKVLRDAGVAFQVFPSIEEWRKWIQN